MDIIANSRDSYVFIGILF